MAQGPLLQNIFQAPRRKMGRQLFSASFLLLSLFMVQMPSTGNALPVQNSHGCACISTTTSPVLIRSVHLIQPGPHCSVLQVIATLKTGDIVCLDPEAPWVKRTVQVLLNRENH